MAEAKRELEDAIQGLQEPEAELVLSLVHHLRAKQSSTEGSAEVQDAPSIREWVEALLVLFALERSPEANELGPLLDRFEISPGHGWIRLSEPALARDWDRPEEDEAWADL